MTTATESLNVSSAEVRMNPRKLAQPIFICLAFLLVIGCITLFSVTSYRSEMKTGDIWMMWAAQFKGYGLGLIFFMVGYWSSPRTWLKSGFAISAAVGLVILLVLTSFSPMGVAKNDAKRWLEIGGILFQPSETAKFILPVLLIYLTGPWKQERSLTSAQITSYGALMMLLLIVVPIGLVGSQPDLGTAAVVAGLCLLPVMRSAVFAQVMLTATVILVPLLIILQSSRFSEFSERFRAVLDPESVDQVRAGFQSIGSGGVFGRGLGEGVGKLGYLPSAYNDFIFSVFAEETGLLGVTVVVVLFGALLYFGRKLWRSLEDENLSIMAMVLTLSITGQAAFNLMVNLAILPTKGIPLPFFSHGSTGLAVFMGMSGILLALTRCRGREIQS